MNVRLTLEVVASLSRTVSVSMISFCFKRCSDARDSIPYISLETPRNIPRTSLLASSSCEVYPIFQVNC